MKCFFFKFFNQNNIENNYVLITLEYFQEGVEFLKVGWIERFRDVIRKLKNHY